MLERVDRALRIVCCLLALVVVYQLARLAMGVNPFSRVKIPELPTLPAEVAGNPPGGTASQPKPSPRISTNAPADPTNAAARSAEVTKTNGVTLAEDHPNTSTNTSAPAATNAQSKSAIAMSGKTDSPGSGKAASSPPAMPQGGMPPGMNPAMAMAMGMGPGMNPMMAMGPMGPGGPRGGAPLPAAAKARVDKITESELLAPVIRPLPMGLIGIAGEYAFLRAPNGQTGLVKEGEELGGVKLVRIGTNRVLVDQDGLKKELTVFSGYGSESLLPNQKDK